MTLKQISSINAGYPFRGKIPELVDSRIMAVQMKDVSVQNGIDWSSCIRTALKDKRAVDWLKPGDILVAARGNHNYAVLVDNTLADHHINAVAAPHFFVLRLHKTTILPAFLAWQLNQLPSQRYFERNAEGTLTKSIRRNVLEDTPVIIPDLAQQYAIVAMAHNLMQQQRIAQQLVRNSELMMAAIASDIFDNEALKYE